MTLACDNVHFEIINYLSVNGADVNANEYLNIAATTNLDIVKMLMDNGADVNSKIILGSTILIEASFHYI